MTRPPLLVMLMGNWVGCLAAIGSGVSLLATWWQMQAAAPWWPPFMGVALIVAALRARSRYAAHQAWKRNWEATAGGTGKTNWRAMLLIVSATLWCGAAWWVSSHEAGTEETQFAAALWLLVSAGWVCWGLWRFFRWAKRKEQAIQARRERDHVVAVALPAPREAGAPNDFTAALPGYCQQLLARSAEGSRHA